MESLHLAQRNRSAIPYLALILVVALLGYWYGSATAQQNSETRDRYRQLFLLDPFEGHQFSLAYGFTGTIETVHGNDVFVAVNGNKVVISITRSLTSVFDCGGNLETDPFTSGACKKLTPDAYASIAGKQSRLSAIRASVTENYKAIAIIV